jgi:predicted amidohydrolase YtcJ
MAKLGIAAAMQPHNLVLDINMVDRCVGELGRWTYSFRDLMDAGVPVIFSSDCPVCSPDPLVGIHAAVTRQRADGTPEGGWYPDQRVTVDEAVAAYTIGPARCYGMAEELGSITPGKRADIVVLDRNIYTIDAAEMVGAKVDMTVFDGRVVFRRRGI